MRAVLKFSPPLIWISFECWWSATRDEWWQLSQNLPIWILHILATERYFSIAKGTPLRQAVFHLLVPFSLYYNRRGQVTFSAGSDKIQKKQTGAPAMHIGGGRGGAGGGALAPPPPHFRKSPHFFADGTFLHANARHSKPKVASRCRHAANIAFDLFNIFLYVIARIVAFRDK